MMPEFTINSQKVVHETLDGETIVIHLETGNYYSLTGSGAEIWALVHGADSAAAICAELARRHERPEEDLLGQVESFVADLAREGLVEDGDLSPASLPAKRDGAGGPW